MILKRLLPASSLLLLLVSISLMTYAQDKTVSGKVTDSKDGSPVVGASVIPKGSTAGGTTTGTDGSYRLTVGANVTTIIISYVGYGTQEVSISGKTDVDVILSSSGSNLNEIVVVGYGTARKRDLTGAVASVKAKDFNQGVITSPDQLIQGKAAGVLIINNSGQPGGATTVRIRGTASIRSGNNPLFVVDGIQLPGGSARPGGGGAGIGTTPGGNPMNFINPNDIASMEILKDASATAIYGSRGANGVIIITTKRGKTGAPSIDFNVSTGFSKILKKLEVLDAEGYRKALSDYSLTSGDYGGDEDAMDAITQTGFTQSYNMAVSGGADNGRYRLSASYLDQEGIIKESGIKKYTANFTSSFKFLESKKLGLDFNILATHTDEQLAPISNDAGFTGSLIGQALQWNPTHPLRKPTDSFPNGVYPVYGDIWVNNQIGNTTVNPLAMLAAHEDRVNVNTIIASISPSYKFTNELEYRFLYSINNSTGVRRNQLARWINIDGINGRGGASIDNEQETTQQFTNTLSYNKQVNSDFNINAVVGHEYLNFTSTGSGSGAQDFVDLGLYYYNFLQYGTQSSRGIYSFASPTSELQSFFGRATVNYKDKYLLTATIRADGSTKFGENKKYGYFPSVSAAWNISNEEFLKTSTVINNLKLRVGWGQTGNQDFVSGASLTRFFFGQQTIAQSNYANPDLQWETSTTANFGVDFSLFDNRLFGSVDYFNKDSKDVLYEQTIVQPAPGGKIWINLPGNIINKGLEITLMGNIVREKDLNWNLGGVVSFLQNNVEGLGAMEFYETGGLHGQGISGVRSQRIVNNQPLNTFYLRNLKVSTKQPVKVFIPTMVILYIIMEVLIRK